MFLTIVYLVRTSTLLLSLHEKVFPGLFSRKNAWPWDVDVIRRRSTAMIPFLVWRWQGGMASKNPYIQLHRGSSIWTMCQKFLVFLVSNPNHHYPPHPRTINQYLIVRESRHAASGQNRHQLNRVWNAECGHKRPKTVGSIAGFRMPSVWQTYQQCWTVLSSFYKAC